MPDNGQVPIKDTIEYWIDPAKKDAKGQPVIYWKTPPPGAAGAAHWNAAGIDLGVGGAAAYKHGVRTVYSDGEIWDQIDGEQGHLADYDRGLASQYAKEQAAGAKAPMVRQGQQWNPDTQQWEPAPGLTPQRDTKSMYLPGQDETGYRELNPDRIPDTFEFTDPNTGARLLKDKTTGRTISILSPGIAGYVPGRGVPAPPSGTDSAAWAQLAWNQQWEPQKFALEQAAKKEAAAALYKQFVEEQAAQDARNKLTNTVKFSGDLMDTWAKAAPQAMLPGQEFLLGAEPGGVYQNIARMSGRQYDPNTMRVPPVSLDPAEAWRQAQGFVRGS